MSRLRERVPESDPCGTLNYFYGGISSGFPLASHFDLPGSQFVSGLSQGPPMLHMHLLAKMASTEKGSG